MSEWSDWKDIGQIRIKEVYKLYSWPGVYKVRITDSEEQPMQIGRFRGDDPDGILTIGESGNVARRLNEFNDAYEGKQWMHSEGVKLFLLVFTQLKAKNEVGVGKKGKIQFAAKRLIDKAEAQMQEEELIKRYFFKYGEAPPLNSTIPDRTGHWDNTNAEEP